MNGYFNYKDELYHHGVLGMKWGVRRYQPYGEGGYNPKSKNVRNKNYSDSQRAQDRRIYGKGSEKRINKRMNNGETILSARHAEIVRKQRLKKMKTIGVLAATAAISIGGPIAIEKLKDSNPEVFSKGKEVLDALLSFGPSSTETAINRINNTYKNGIKTSIIRNSTSDVVKLRTKPLVDVTTKKWSPDLSTMTMKDLADLDLY